MARIACGCPVALGDLAGCAARQSLVERCLFDVDDRVARRQTNGILKSFFGILHAILLAKQLAQGEPHGGRVGDLLHTPAQGGLGGRSVTRLQLSLALRNDCLGGICRWLRRRGSSRRCGRF